MIKPISDGSEEDISHAKILLVDGDHLSTAALSQSLKQFDNLTIYIRCIRVTTPLNFAIKYGQI
jgi:hypothetical protein